MKIIYIKKSFLKIQFFYKNISNLKSDNFLQTVDVR